MYKFTKQDWIDGMTMTNQDIKLFYKEGKSLIFEDLGYDIIVDDIIDTIRVYLLYTGTYDKEVIKNLSISPLFDDWLLIIQRFHECGFFQFRIMPVVFAALKAKESRL